MYVLTLILPVLNSHNLAELSFDAPTIISEVSLNETDVIDCVDPDKLCLRLPLLDYL